ncbi:MAG: BREX-4 system phosphatase PglZ, partial [Selenomonadaceae bacterium]|nr:BREX-4 system phosphatase PglZ [Selenomonadaceae bacterium]
YKKQKLTNKTNPEFLQKVEEYAKTRPYNKFLTRLSLLNKVSEKSAEVFFFDALGVEYLSYIAAKCEELGLMTDIKIGHSELPSITSMNRDFYNYFKEENIHKIGELDECKHHSKKFDYQKCREPLHIFEELQIIDDEINKIYAKMTFEHIEKAVIVSDHGASRLAVINESENDAVVLSEKGEHSGRCAPAENDPEIPFATYENGYAVLANYDRFKGGRKADVEVHGGATLEEVLVPIIVLSLRPEKLEYSFAESEILFKPGQDAHLVLFCNAPMNKPQLKVGDKYYGGSFTVDKQHAEFYIEGARRKGKYNAEVYEGEVFSGISLSFEIKKQTQEDDLGI